MSLVLLSGCGGDGGLSSLFGGGDSSGANSGPPVSNTPLQEPHPTAVEASRFLTQATFGPTDASIDGLTQSTLNDWITQQEAMPQTSHLADLDARLVAYRLVDPNAYINEDDFYDSFWDKAVTGDDQLRQRVAFALSEIFVTSFTNPNVDTRGMADYYDMLGRDAFGNYRDLLQDVTLHPMMGVYLNMLGNQKESPGRHPDENYAREIMQLMTIGLYKLNLDGTRALTITGDPQPTYTQTDIKGLAKVFTGWSWYNPNPDDGTFYGWPRDDNAPVHAMIPYANFHSISQKRFLTANILASATPDPEGDLNVALDTLFNNPNVGPFIGKQLIQRLVTSNPSPAYVKRVATVFNNNGHGVRGDMKAVIRAILTDPEARSATNIADPSFGKLREPVVRLGHLLRAFNATSYTGQWRIRSTAPNWSLSQAALDAPSVFNFWRPGYVPPQTTLGRNNFVAPEFQGANEVSVAGYINTLQYTINYGIGDWQGDTIGNDVQLNLAAEFAMAEDPNALVDHLNRLLLYGQMSSKLRAHVVTAINSVELGTLAEGWTQEDIDNAKLNRVRTAIFLTMASPDYLSQK
ncbi:MAG: DUF1800 domain-containing protein [Asticcacaulis sp.]|nr:DUF1800 domain-containing protein [Asticcacaulis sp.]